MSKITRDVLAQVADIEEELQTFHGLRHLWSNQVANHSATVFGGQVDPDTLLREQAHRLQRVVSMSLTLFDMMYPNADAPHDKFRRVQDSEKEY